MSTHSSKFWALAFPISLLILAAAYYIKVPSVRRAIDSRTTFAHDLLGRFVQEPTVVELPPKETPSPKFDSPNGPIAIPTFAPSPVETPATPEPFSLPKLAADRSRWPKKVALNRPVTFPAMINGKAFGSMVVPAGAEVSLVDIKDGRLRLDFQGGTAWLSAGDTDLEARVGRR